MGQLTPRSITDRVIHHPYRWLLISCGIIGGVGVDALTHAYQGATLSSPISDAILGTLCLAFIIVCLIHSWPDTGDETSADHVYRSTACQHARHSVCRHTCKFCSVRCNCPCHLLSA